MLAALVGVGALGLPAVGAAPVGFSTTPLAGWSTNGTVLAVLVVGDTVYAGGDFTQVRGPGGSPTMARSRLAAFDANTGAVRTGFTRRRQRLGPRAGDRRDPAVRRRLVHARSRA